MSPDYLIPTTYSRIVARELGLQERELPELLLGTGLATDVLLAGDESRISGQQQLRVLANARRMSGDPAMGLRLGSRLDPRAHGPIGYLALSSPDLLTALQSLRDFLPIRIPFASLDLLERGPVLACRLQILLPAPAAELRMLVECFALVIQSLVEGFLGRDLTEAQVDFAFEEPDYSARYRDFIHCTPRFAQSENRVLLPIALVSEGNLVGDPNSYAAARDMCAGLLEQVPVTALSMTQRVKRFLLAQPAGSVNEEDVARSLYISRRTLGRRLQAEGTSYRRIRDDIMAEMAALQLRRGVLSVESIAALLGYHDSANFRRAFRRWYGCSPQSFRDGHRRATAS